MRTTSAVLLALVLGVVLGTLWTWALHGLTDRELIASAGTVAACSLTGHALALGSRPR